MTTVKPSPFSRMVLVTEQEYSHIAHLPDMSTEKYIGPDQQHKMKVAKKVRKQTTLPPSITDHISTISSSFPKGKVANALALLTFLNDQKPLFSWDEYGQLKIQDNTLVGSNLFDLIRYAVSDSRKRTHIPVGWDEFKTILTSTNVSKKVLSKATLEELGLRGRRRRRTTTNPPGDETLTNWEEA